MAYTTTVLNDDVRILRFTLGGGVFDGEPLADSEHWNVVNLLTDQVDAGTVSTILGAQRIVIDAGFSSSQVWQDALHAAGILDVVESVQEVTKIVLPLYSFHKLLVPGEIPYWESERIHQENEIYRWAGAFANAGLVFLLDAILPNSSPLALVYQSIESEILFAPDVSGGLLTLEELSETLKEELFRPNDGSVLIQPQPHYLSSAAREAAQLYRGMYNLMPQVQTVSMRPTEFIPFAVRVNEVRSTADEHARKLVSILPTPADFGYIEENRQYWESRKDVVAETPTEALGAKVIEENTLEEIPAEPPPEPGPDSIIDPLVNPAPVVTPMPGRDITSAMLEMESETEFEPKPDPDPEPTLPPPPRYPIPAVNTQSIQEKIAEKSSEQLSGDVKRIFRSNLTQTKAETTAKKVVQRKKIRKQSKKRRALFYIGIVFVGVGMGLGALLGWFQFSVTRAQAELTRLLADSTISANKAQISWGTFNTQLNMMKPMYGLFSAILELPVVDTARDLMETSDKLAALEKSTLAANQSVILTFKSIWKRDSGSVGELSKTMTTELRNHHVVLDEFSRVAQIGGGDAVLGLSSDSSTGKASAILDEIIPKLGEIFGETANKNYVVILQNSQELRPTGGFIEAVALLSFAKGSISGVETYSSYQLDNKMQTQITPPEDLQRILGEQQWWLRDANWYPDGPKTSEQIARVAHSTIGKQPDGVIILNTLSLPAILAATGPIELPEFNEVLTDKNIAERLEFHTELPHQMAENKVEYRGAILKALVSKLGQLSDDQTQAFLRVIQQELDNRQLLLYSTDEKIQQSFAKFGWVGSFAFPSCPAPFNEHDCETDGIAQIETNVGVNRANAYIDREVTHNIALTPEGASHTHSITWQNRAQTQAWPKGDYRVYVRLYVPRQVTSVSATLNGIPVSAQEIMRQSSQNTEEIGLVVVVPIKEKATLEVTYTTPMNLNKAVASYLFYQVRQPGTTTNLAPVTINHPESWRVDTVAPEPESLSPALVFGSETAPHTVQIVQFTQAK